MFSGDEDRDYSESYFHKYCIRAQSGGLIANANTDVGDEDWVKNFDGWGDEFEHLLERYGKENKNKD